MLFSVRAASVIEVVAHRSVAQKHTCKNSQGLTYGYPDHPVHITMANFGKVSVNFTKLQEVSELSDAVQDIFQIKEEYYPSPYDARRTTTDRFVNAID